tara:strand:+ start:297 stop:938 length:642 start_codon:yes stop_codon:yes gene_type:complete
MATIEKLRELYKKYNLAPEDVFKHKHYTIISRSGIEKIAAAANITVNLTLEKVESNFAVVKAICYTNLEGSYIETFGSALKGGSHLDGNCNTWYVVEMAEKRAMSRGVLKAVGLYSEDVKGAEESEEFRPENSGKITAAQEAYIRDTIESNWFPPKQRKAYEERLASGPSFQNGEAMIEWIGENKPSSIMLGNSASAKELVDLVNDKLNDPKA